jgi:hypothetical protein
MPDTPRRPPPIASPASTSPFRSRPAGRPDRGPPPGARRARRAIRGDRPHPYIPARKRPPEARHGRRPPASCGRCGRCARAAPGTRRGPRPPPSFRPNRNPDKPGGHRGAPAPLRHSASGPVASGVVADMKHVSTRMPHRELVQTAGRRLGRPRNLRAAPDPPHTGVVDILATDTERRGAYLRALPEEDRAIPMRHGPDPARFDVPRQFEPQPVTAMGPHRRHVRHGHVRHRLRDLPGAIPPGPSPPPRRPCSGDHPALHSGKKTPGGAEGGGLAPLRALHPCAARENRVPRAP